MRKILLVILFACILPTAAWAEAVKGKGTSSGLGSDTACVFVTDCTWASGLPVDLGGCGCYSKDYLEKILLGIEQGIYSVDAVIECEGPPWPETACVCVEGACRMDLLTQYDAETTPKSKALDIAKDLCEQEGYEWKDVSVEDNGAVWRIQTGGLQLGGNAEILVDKSTGEVVEQHFNSR